MDPVVFPVFHPAAALYTPANRKVLEEDFAKLRRLWSRGWPGSGVQRPAGKRTTKRRLCRRRTHLEPRLRRRRGPFARDGEQLPLW